MRTTGFLALAAAGSIMLLTLIGAASMSPGGTGKAVALIRHSHVCSDPEDEYDPEVIASARAAPTRG